jgi:hypothetical protein
VRRLGHRRVPAQWNTGWVGLRQSLNTLAVKQTIGRMSEHARCEHANHHRQNDNSGYCHCFCLKKKHVNFCRNVGETRT